MHPEEGLDGVCSYLFAGFNLTNRKSENHNKEKNFHGSEEIVAGKKG